MTGCQQAMPRQHTLCMHCVWSPSIICWQGVNTDSKHGCQAVSRVPRCCCLLLSLQLCASNANSLTLAVGWMAQVNVCWFMSNETHSYIITWLPETEWLAELTCSPQPNGHGRGPVVCTVSRCSSNYNTSVMTYNNTNNTQTVSRTQLYRCNRVQPKTHKDTLNTGLTLVVKTDRQTQLNSLSSRILWVSQHQKG